MNMPLANRFCSAILFAGFLMLSCSGCAYWKVTDNLPSLNPKVRREREIARQVKNDPFPAAGKSAKNPL
jgi:hypothetical protein